MRNSRSFDGQDYRQSENWQRLTQACTHTWHHRIRPGARFVPRKCFSACV